MNIEEVKKLCEEHSSLKETNRLLKKSVDKDEDVSIKTSYGENYLSRDAIEMVTGINIERMQQIEKVFEGVKNE